MPVHRLATPDGDAHRDRNRRPLWRLQCCHLLHSSRARARVNGPSIPVAETARPDFRPLRRAGGGWAMLMNCR